MFKEISNIRSFNFDAQRNEIRLKYGLELGELGEHEEVEIEILDENEDEEFFITKQEDGEVNEHENEEFKSQFLDHEIIIEEEYIEEELEDSNEEKAMLDKKTDAERLYRFQCHLCNDKEFFKMHELTTHCKQFHNTKPQVECICGQKLSTWKRLMEHKSRHSKDDKEFSCSECNLSYKTEAAYEKHIDKKHGENAEKYICSRKLTINISILYKSK